MGQVDKEDVDVDSAEWHVLNSMFENGGVNYILCMLALVLVDQDCGIGSVDEAISFIKRCVPDGESEVYLQFPQ